jgi:hypothetical protein
MSFAWTCLHLFKLCTILLVLMSHTNFKLMISQERMRIPLVKYLVQDKTLVSCNLWLELSLMLTGFWFFKCLEMFIFMVWFWSLIFWVSKEILCKPHESKFKTHQTMIYLSICVHIFMCMTLLVSIMLGVNLAM